MSKKKTTKYNIILVDKCRDLFKQKSTVEFQHIYKEANKVADWLA